MGSLLKPKTPKAPPAPKIPSNQEQTQARVQEQLSKPPAPIKVQMPEMPEPVKPRRMPTMMDETVKTARQRAYRRRRGALTRRNTILTDTDVLGG